MSYQEELAERLKTVREDVARMGTREFARAVGEAGVEITHPSVRRREDGETEDVPAAYLAVICERWDIHPVWMLTGRGRRTWGERTDVESDRLAAADWMERLAGELREGER